MNDAQSSAIKPIVRAIEEEFSRRPPTICVIGLSGVGKSSTINAMFGTKRHVSATTRGTTNFTPRTYEIVSNRMEGSSVRCALKVVDAVGLGEDADKDENYLLRYRHHLPKCDIALWVVAARNRALALDQQYLRRLTDALPNLVIGVNQADLVDPLTWDERINMPSRDQQQSIQEILADRHAKLSRYAKNDCSIVAYSALKYYNLQNLFATCLKAAPPNRRWMFELLKSFTTHDWLNRAKGLTGVQREHLARSYIKSNSKIVIHKLPE